METSNWRKIKTFLKSEDCKDIHYMIWDDFAVITTPFGERIKIEKTTAFFQVKAKVTEILKYLNYGKA